MFWKVLAIPQRHISLADLPVKFTPSSTILPSVGEYTPVRRLNTVVLPAPLGPISP